ncbi:MAG: succinate dehydrogenase assembly factor 2 [Mariprofundales bacterium]
MTDAMALRRARFRLQRQGVLELDRWLIPLSAVLDDHPDLLPTIESLLSQEPALLQQMMEGEVAIPEPLQRWLH